MCVCKRKSLGGGGGGKKLLRKKYTLLKKVNNITPLYIES